MGKAVWIAIEKQNEDTTSSALTSFPQGIILVEKGPTTRIWQVGQSDFYQLQVGGPLSGDWWYGRYTGWNDCQDLQANFDSPVSTNVWQ